jgi:hypothetical protein
MTAHWQTIHADVIDGFDVIVSVAPEDTDPNNHLNDEETVQAIANGALDWFMVRVEAQRAGATLGLDYLGGCCYRSALDFVRETDGYYVDMVSRALDDARETIRKINA